MKTSRYIFTALIRMDILVIVKDLVYSAHVVMEFLVNAIQIVLVSLNTFASDHLSKLLCFPSTFC